MTVLFKNSLKGAPGWLCGLKRHVDLWIRVECPDMDHQLYGQKIFDKAEKIIQWKKDSLFNQWCWKHWTAMFGRMTLNHSLIPYIKINSKWTNDLNVRQESIKILEENIGSNLLDTATANSFKTCL